MSQGFFITGTDTDIGKTTAARALMQNLKRNGYSVNAFKPVAAGCEQTPNGLRNEDAVKLNALSSINVDYRLVNPYAYEAPIAPHIAAENTLQPIKIDHIKQCYEHIHALADYTIVEGAGGWLVPINEQQTMAHVVKALRLPVLVVVGMKLGCINHSLLTFDAIKQHGCHVAGWIANTLDCNMNSLDDNLAFLKRRLPAPLLATIPYLQSIDDRIDAIFDLQALRDYKPPH